MLTLLLMATALGTPPGYDVTRENVEGCTLMLGPREADGVVPMRAECHWPEVSLERVDEVLAPWDAHDTYFSSVSVSEVRSQEGATTEVRQIHVARGIADREVFIRGARTDLEGGGFRYAWSLSPDPGESDLINPDRNDGSWEVRPHPDGGVAVVYDLAYDPGGRVPGFLVRWFQTSGLAAIVTELHAVVSAP